MNSQSLPPGYKFKPTDEELCQFLNLKVRQQKLPSNAVVAMDVYGREPWLLEWNASPGFNPNDKYYLVQRKMMSKNGNGKRPRRCLEGNLKSGRWVATSGDKDIVGDGCTVGRKKTLKFVSYKDQNGKGKEGMIKTNWIMHEYSLPENNFQEWVLCRIKKEDRKNKKTLENKTNSVAITDDRSDLEEGLADDRLVAYVDSLDNGEKRLEQPESHQHSCPITKDLMEWALNFHCGELGEQQLSVPLIFYSADW